GFMKPDLFIGLEYIDQFGVDTVFLNTYPKNKIKGMTVINDAGKKVGVVTGLEFAAANKLKSIIVKGGVLTGPSIVSVAHIREIGEKVILKPEIQIKEEQVEEEPPKETF
ncbi:hypothetical protein GOV05_00600, partial [Candidatus Woesearchaeota archaeon]|nr:hypothetical protein [Candidatus Woesearchaeota archaeon]